MKEEINERTGLLRRWMEREGLGAVVLPTMDPHNSEYVAAHWQTRQWFTGFTGSAGTAVVTPHEALLWTDSRYWLQAEEQLQPTPFRLMREGQDEPVATWLEEHTEGPIGFAEDMMVPALYAELFSPPTRHRATALPASALDFLWPTRPALPLSRAELMPEQLAGETAESKLGRILEWMVRHGRQELFVSELSEIAWTLNLRADDIPFNPFLISFLLLRASGRHTLFVHAEQLDADVRHHLSGLGIGLAPYAEGLAMQQQRLTEPDEESPIADFRAQKNDTEIEGFREAHRRDGVAMVQFLRLLDEAKGQGWTELTVDEVLTGLRARQEGFRGRSFETIAAAGPHGAIVHYEATEETSVPLPDHGFLLLDSGAHYDCGTTDITRTIALGPLTDEERRVYTLVLRGHLQLQNLHFPEGTTGLQLDTAARAAMWREGYDFGHGTGHGVGHRLGVHEGPLQIRKNVRPCTLLNIRAQQVITDEPGIYVAGRFGVRTENMLLCREAAATDFGRFLRFEPLTLCPYDRRAIVPHMLSAEEREWLNAYHARVRSELEPLLSDPADRLWLCQATEPLPDGLRHS